ncbi:uncharacterized protein L969DRAFT_50616 [Mixia osmundae IAM 14324]|uniref:Uncharacterized protein n=1 Tax=Mixia osmundae (strain CBS 9802 / IAM 14324 / JCM 22182 / KY 12970) TaxID=764103 RepID=G7E762_MIXOS|nr:uncharacterized protein L969DRAFT_50616 [Mixia osmundae IAM 14324]KEI38942.1 hypothetical protein L969DRAFT_50616 [Mixia osmundae IAM 14324]GAA98672.1 hypothetical protein E5Q_05360 [Mixia osmundae IAM 14324]
MATPIDRSRAATPSLPHQPTQLELLREASVGVAHLLNDDIEAAKTTLAAQPECPYHLTGLGITRFMEASLGMETQELAVAMTTLFKAESVSKAAKTVKTDQVRWWHADVEHDILIADAVIGQAIIHILSGSYLDFVKAAYKLQRCHSLFEKSFKQIYPDTVTDKDSAATINRVLEDKYATAADARAKGAPTMSRQSSSWSLFKRSESAASTPNSVKNGKVPAKDLQKSLAQLKLGSSASVDKIQTPTAGTIWQDEMASLVISGALFGHGLFELVFALLPPKVRKVTSFVGFSNGNRRKALTLLEVPAIQGSDIHASFASLALLTYHGLVLLMSGWQAQEAELIDQCSTILSRVEQRFPEGTLWLLNRAKILRMKGQVEEAIKVLQDARNSSFKQAESIVWFELCWCWLSMNRWEEAAHAFSEMTRLSAWSHGTYTFTRLGCYLQLEHTPENIARVKKCIEEELPQQIGKKKIMGSTAPIEQFILSRLGFWQRKLDRAHARGRKDVELWQIIKINPALEIAIQWNGIPRAPAKQQQETIDSLLALSPPIDADWKTVHADADLDTIEELAIRALLLGISYRSLGKLEEGRKHLHAASQVAVELPTCYAAPAAKLELGILLCVEADRNAKGKSKEEARPIYKAAFADANRLFESALAASFDMDSRLASRITMLRVEMDDKKAQLAI